MAVSCRADLLDGRYRLVEEIAVGGMGVVWRGVDTALDRPVAIKLIRAEYAGDPTFRDRLRGEARAIAAIDSPHVVRIFDVGEQPDPGGGVRSYLVMELVEGVPLSSRLRGTGRLAPPTVAAIVGQTASALAAAHAQGIVHRDVKPANLLIGTGERLTVVDFGIARAADAVPLTATNTLLGTAHYLSPEQTVGQTATAASDVYALGVVAYRCLAGRLPFSGDGHIAVALAHREQPVPELPDGIPAGLAALVHQMLAKAPGDRPSAADIATGLTEDRASILDPTPAPATAPIADATAMTQLTGTDVTGRAADRSTWRRALTLAAAGGAIGVTVALLAGFSDGRGVNPDPAAPAVSAHAPSHPAKPTVSTSARPPAGTPRPSAVHHTLTRQGAAPSHKPAPPTAKPTPKPPKQRAKQPTPKQQSKPPAPKQKPTPPAPTRSATSPTATSPPPTGSATPPASPTPPSPSPEDSPTPSTASPQPSPDN